MTRVSGPRSAPAQASAPKAWTPPRKGEWTQTMTGGQSDPVNLYVHGSLPQLEAAFKKAGWSVADPKSIPNAAKYVAAAAGDVFIQKPAQAVTDGLVGAWDAITGSKDKVELPNPFQGAVDEMPVSDQTFRGKKEVVAFEKDNDPLGGRHHFRIFDTGQKDAQGRPVWAIAATRDIAVHYDLGKPQDYFTEHDIQKNADPERDFVLKALTGEGVVASKKKLNLTYGERPDGATAHGAYDVVLKP